MVPTGPAPASAWPEHGSCSDFGGIEFETAVGAQNVAEQTSATMLLAIWGTIGQGARRRLQAARHEFAREDVSAGNERPGKGLHSSFVPKK